MSQKHIYEFPEKYGEKITYCDAIYTPSNVPEYKGNPLIEALPVYFNGNEPVEAFSNYPFAEDGERRRSVAYRLQALSRVRTFIETMPWHLSVMRDMYRAIWQGYVYRNPLEKKSEQVQRNYRTAKEMKVLVPMYNVIPSHSATFGLLGAPGIGKTTAVTRSLSFLPQVIRHPDYHFTQLVWVKVDCPPDGSLGQLMEWTLEAVDRALDSSYRTYIGTRSTLNERMQIVGSVLERHQTGLLVLDEIQNVLRDAKTRYSNIDFFMSFANNINVPAMHVGLPSAMSLYPDNMHSKRRATDSGIRLLPPQMSEDEWSLYSEELSNYQWTRGHASAEMISRSLKDRTQRNPGLASRLFELSQAIAIESNERALSEALIKKVFDERFTIVRPFVDAIEKSATTEIERHGKAVSDIERLVSEEVQQAIDRARFQELVERKVVHETVNNATASLLYLGMPQDDVVRKLKVLAKSKPDADAEWLVVNYLSGRGQKQALSREVEGRIAKILEQEQRELAGKRERK